LNNVQLDKKVTNIINLNYLFFINNSFIVVQLKLTYLLLCTLMFCFDERKIWLFGWRDE